MNEILKDLIDVFDWGQSHLQRHGINVDNFGNKYQVGTAFTTEIDKMINEMQNKVYIPLTDVDFHELIFSSFTLSLGLNNASKYSSEEVALMIGIVILSKGYTVRKEEEVIKSYSKVI